MHIYYLTPPKTYNFSLQIFLAQTQRNTLFDYKRRHIHRCTTMHNYKYKFIHLNIWVLYPKPAVKIYNTSKATERKRKCWLKNARGQRGKEEGKRKKFKTTCRQLWKIFNLFSLILCKISVFVEYSSDTTKKKRTNK